MVEAFLKKVGSEYLFKQDPGPPLSNLKEKSKGVSIQQSHMIRIRTSRLNYTCQANVDKEDDDILHKNPLQNVASHHI